LILFSGCTSTQKTQETNQSQTSQLQTQKTPPEDCVEGTSSISTGEFHKNEHEAIAFCENACREFGTEYYGHMGEDVTGQGYLMVMCYCWGCQ